MFALLLLFTVLAQCWRGQDRQAASVTTACAQQQRAQVTCTSCSGCAARTRPAPGVLARASLQHARAAWAYCSG